MYNHRVYSSSNLFPSKIVNYTFDCMMIFDCLKQDAIPNITYTPMKEVTFSCNLFISRVQLVGCLPLKSSNVYIVVATLWAQNSSQVSNFTNFVRNLSHLPFFSHSLLVLFNLLWNQASWEPVFTNIPFLTALYVLTFYAFSVRNKQLVNLDRKSIYFNTHVQDIRTRGMVFDDQGCQFRILCLILQLNEIYNSILVRLVTESLVRYVILCSLFVFAQFYENLFSALPLTCVMDTRINHS